METAAEGPVPFFFGGRLCLDFVNTVNSRSRPATRDYLPDWQALIGWCGQTALFDNTILKRLQAQAASAPRRAEEAHAAALALREGLYRIFRNVIDRASPRGEDMDLLNRCLRNARARQVLAAAGTDFFWGWDEARLDLDSPLHAVALSAGSLLAEDELARLKECPGPEGCGWLFYDETKNASRRWCSMAHCGGAAKARRYAARHGA
ncbi:ABATE domain-containing protein [Chelativorans sp.]|uniref:CGNR zinc finger domain-containing protein n=1 Tax=Chelativorans sp. TaxID=2203393 RepID=UPI002811F8E2|nr:ABATE domain-containing protein [Chelativorans sp.]